MKCSAFTIRLTEEHVASDETILNGFLEGVRVSQIFSSFNAGSMPSWSVLIFYDDRNEDKTSYDKMEFVSTTDEVILLPREENIYNALKKWRNDRAMAEGVPPFVIARNDWLKQMAKMGAKSKEDLLRVKGFGRKRIEKYGDDLLEVMESI